MAHSENWQPEIEKENWQKIATLLSTKEDDAVMVFWGPLEDVKTALETIEERCRMAFEGIPNETRKSFSDGTTIFERVLPGADRMYPDTDSAPIPLEDDYIESLRKNLPTDIIDRYKQLKKWNVPEDTYTYLFSKNYYPILDRLVNELGVEPVFGGTFIGHRLKNLLGKQKKQRQFNPEKIYKLFAFLKEQKLDHRLAWHMLPEIIIHPRMDFESVLSSLKFRKTGKEEILNKLPFLSEKFVQHSRKNGTDHRLNWMMGQLRKQSTGNIDLTFLANQIKTMKS